MSGFVAGEGGAITQAAGAAYSSKNAGARTITAALTPLDFVANAGTALTNYILPTTATGPGTINPAPLVITVVGNPTKAYDGNDSASMAPANYEILGLVSGEDMTVTETHGTYSLGRRRHAHGPASTWTPATWRRPPTPCSQLHHPLPVYRDRHHHPPRHRPGVIYAAITGNPTKVYDGNTVATLTPTDYTLDGFITGEGAIVTQTVGTYGDPQCGLPSGHRPARAHRLHGRSRHQSRQLQPADRGHGHRHDPAQDADRQHHRQSDQGL